MGEYSAVARTNVDSAQKYRTCWGQYITGAAFSRGLVPVYRDAGFTGNHSSGLLNRATGAQVHSGLIGTIVNAAK